jgi:hypothetical protein
MLAEAFDLRPRLVAVQEKPSPGFARRRSIIWKLSPSSPAKPERMGSADRRHCSWERTPGFVCHT